MKESIVYFRNLISKFLYKNLFKRIFFLIDSEKIHNMMLKFGRILGSNIIIRKLTGLLFSYQNKKLEQKILGIKFKNPVGLAAGFDKNAEITSILPCVGFGFTEIGSITAKPCIGNPKPRLWRLKKSKGLVVYYGLKNDGANTIKNRLIKKQFEIPLGINIAKTNCRETVDEKAGIRDYVTSIKILKDLGDYFTINISCPNAYGGLPFTNSDSLDELLYEIRKISINKPILLKLPPDLQRPKISQIIELAKKYKIAGFICTNLVKDRSNKKILKMLRDKDIPEKGGISGLPARDLSTEVIRYIYKKTKGKFIIIGCGGIFSAYDAYEKIKNGASLVQLITGMIFEGPQLISDINLGLLELLKKDGYSNLSEAIGKSSKL